MGKRIPRYMIYQIYFTLGSTALFSLLIALGNNAKGWDGLTFTIGALTVAALWALASAVFMTWIIIRERGRKNSWQAMGFLAGVIMLIGLLAA